MAKKQSKFDFSGTIAYVRGLIQEEVGCRNVAVIDDDAGEGRSLDAHAPPSHPHFGG